ncbi:MULTISPECIES: GNAT family N-acetyltransferase [Actinoalloteichus]|uniref:Acetyltransferase, ribosomal protein N-acetylase n=1 Tax=Actinoalloteichus fjordicus TaxID=1612552 RepID=A0AAC9PSE3_9PSEU|nr:MULTISPECIES: GNAT family N-acetyltransferase [Actinoalloteichus]APU15053.1 acetyltransferase, ribosomal protein N-acetylase [Actinoalloteichus fjordicus]APU21121.1 acetyltransferase, ribosomal protein N-acetylase [Actinoalloteichus sp. GBA129-24]
MTEHQAAETVSTRRLSLRRPVRHDVDAILAVHRDPRTCAHNPSDRLHTAAEAEQLFHRWDTQWDRFGIGYLVLREHDSDTALGFCGVKSMLLKDRAILNLFYRLAPTAWGRGLASEAARAVVDWATRRMPEPPIVARVRPANIASQHVARHAGLSRAAHLDGPGPDGLDWIYVSAWPE